MATLDDAVGAYVKLRDMKKAMQEKHKEELAPINEKMLKVEGFVHRELNRLGAQNAKTPHGTCYLSTITKPKVEDWGAFINYVRKEDLWDMLDRRPNKTAVDEYVESTGDVPPGLSIQQETNVRFRK